MKATSKLAAALVFVLPLVVHAPQLLGVLKGDPALFYSGLGANLDGALLQGSFTIDPNVGFIDDASAVRGVSDLVHGSLPWWNPYEGVGMPLAGEMQTSPFFPLMALLLLPHGVVWLQAFVQSFAALFTFLVFTELGLGVVAATSAAVVFAFNGTFAWLSGVWSYSLPALPLLVLGIERAASECGRRSAGGIVLIALAIALAISAGFVEIAYLNCLLAAVWAIVRIVRSPRDRRARYLGRLSAGASIGLLLASPILVAFGDYLRYAIVGIHDGSSSGGALPPVGMLQLAFPYILGPIFRFDAFNGTLWGAVGGYGGVATSVLAISALAGRSHRAVRIALAAWIVLSIGATFGVPLFMHVFAVVPGIKYIAVYRYIDASWQFAIAALIAFALSDARLLRASQLLRRVFVSSLVVFAFALYLLSTNAAALDAQTSSADFTTWASRSLLVGLGLLDALPAIVLVIPARRALAIGALVCIEAIGYYVIPILSLPRAGHLELGSVHYLQAHLGFDRFYTLGPISPNYGSRYGIASINHNDLPIPKRWVDRIHDRLDPAAPPLVFTGTIPGGAPARAATLVQNLSEFENVGVRYVVTSPGSHLAGVSVDVPHAATGRTSYELRSGDRLRLELSLAPGHLENLAVFQANGRGTADGTLSVRLCDIGGCHDSVATSLRGAVDNAYLPIAFRAEPLILGGPATLEFSYRGGRHAVTLFAFDRAPESKDRLTVRGGDARKTLGLTLAYVSQSAKVAVSFSRSAGRQGTPGTILRGTAPDGLDYGTIDAIELPFDRSVGESGDAVSLRVCGPSACRHGTSRLEHSSRSEDLRVKLDAPLYLGSVPPFIQVALPAARATGSRTASVAQASFDDIGAQRIREVFADAVSEVYRLPTAAPYFSAARCRFADVTRTSLRAQCDAASRLERLELFMPGWQASLNGAAAPITPEDQTFQGIDLPAGASRVTFAFTPEYEPVAFVAFAIGVVTLLVVVRNAGRMRHAAKDAA